MGSKKLNKSKLHFLLVNFHCVQDSFYSFMSDGVWYFHKTLNTSSKQILPNYIISNITHKNYWPNPQLPDDNIYTIQKRDILQSEEPFPLFDGIYVYYS